MAIKKCLRLGNLSEKWFNWLEVLQAVQEAQQLLLLGRPQEAFNHGKGKAGARSLTGQEQKEGGVGVLNNQISRELTHYLKQSTKGLVLNHETSTTMTGTQIQTI